MKDFKFDGAWTALITPFNNDGSIDWESYSQNIEFQISQGITGILPAGTTGESPVLNWEEHQKVIDKALDVARGRSKVLAGTGSNSTREALEASKHAHDAGADAVLLVDCYYNGPSSLELRKEYYETILDGVPGIHAIPYIIPGRTGCELSVEDLVILSGKYSGVHAVKEATGDLDRMRKTRDLCGYEFEIMSGDDDMTFEMMSDSSIRATGAISVISNVVPAAIEKMTRAILSEDLETAEKLKEALEPLSGMVTVKAENERQLPNGTTVTVTDKFRNPMAIKTLMSGLGMSSGQCRKPLGKMTASGVRIVRDVAQETHRRDPEFFMPIEDIYKVNIEERLASDDIWGDLCY